MIITVEAGNGEGAEDLALLRRNQDSARKTVMIVTDERGERDSSHPPLGPVTVITVEAAARVLVTVVTRGDRSEGPAL